MSAPRPWANDAIVSLMGSNALLRLAFFRQHLARDPEGLDARGDPRVHRDLDERLLDLLARAAVAQRTAQMGLELGLPVQGRQETEVVEAALLEREHAAAPARPPAPLGHHLLEVRAELVAVRERLVHVLVAEHLPPDLHALLVELGLSHCVALLRRLRGPRTPVRAALAFHHTDRHYAPRAADAEPTPAYPMSRPG